MTLTRSAMKSRLDEQRDADREEGRAWRELCRFVNERDGYRCRCCQRHVVFSLKRQDARAEHHHVIPLSLGGPDTQQNVALICLKCHEDRHVKRTLHITGNANKKLTFEQDGKTWIG